LSILVSPEHQDELPAITDRLARGEFIEHFETERVRKDGKRIQVSLTMSPVKDGEGNIIGASKIGRDITARKEEDRRKNEFLALLAHELRNPLAPLRNGLQVIKLAGDDRSAIEQARSVMERQLQHLVRLVDDLLDVARISGDKLHLRKSHITIAAVIQQSLELCGQNLRDQQHELILSLPDEPLYVNADPTRLVQAICNLLSNAAKYSESGKPVWLTVAREKDEAVIRVKDMGIGIPADMLPRVFDMFVQVDRSLEKSQGGLGIGLSLVKRLVEMHGGHVEAHSEGEGQGSEFVVRLPLVAPGMDEELTTAKSNHACLTAGRRILVVDDNTDAANSLTMLLRIMGHEVHVAHNGQSGLDLATEIRPDVVLLDIGMPELNGYEVARRIRQEPWGNLITLVALTGWGQDEDRRKADEAGFDVHMVKPIEPAALDRLLSGADPESV
jgi:signal transduction histidine kinase